MRVQIIDHHQHVVAIEYAGAVDGRIGHAAFDAGDRVRTVEVQIVDQQQRILRRHRACAQHVLWQHRIGIRRNGGRGDCRR